MESFCTEDGIAQEFLALNTPQQNGVVERKNIIQGMARAMIHNKDVAKDLWAEAINIACHIVN